MKPLNLTFYFHVITYYNQAAEEEVATAALRGGPCGSLLDLVVVLAA